MHRPRSPPDSPRDEENEALRVQAVTELSDRLMQARARIESQEHALRSAAEEAQEAHARASHAEHAAEVMGHRMNAAEAHCRLAAQELDRLRGADEMCKWLTEKNHSLEEALAATQRGAHDMHAAATSMVVGAGTAAVDRDASARALEADLREAREQISTLREQLFAAQDRNRALETQIQAQRIETDGFQRRLEVLQLQSKSWKKERSALLKEVDTNTSEAIRRREELHFTRTNLLREQ